MGEPARIVKELMVFLKFLTDTMSIFTQGPRECGSYRLGTCILKPEKQNTLLIAKIIDYKAVMDAVNYPSKSTLPFFFSNSVVAGLMPSQRAHFLVLFGA